MMRQQILGRVLPALARGVVARTFAADAAAPAAAGALAEAYKKVAPNLDPPSTPAAFLGERPATPAALPDKITLNFVLPHQSPFWEKQVDSVIIPATTGQMGVLPGHVPSIAELKPGVLSVVDGSSESKYFVSSGFAIVNPNSVVDVCAVEAVPLDQLDPEEVKKGLATYSAKLASGTGTELEKAEAQIGVDVHSAMSAALGI